MNNLNKINKNSKINTNIKKIDSFYYILDKKNKPISIERSEGMKTEAFKNVTKLKNGNYIVEVFDSGDTNKCLLDKDFNIIQISHNKFFNKINEIGNGRLIIQFKVQSAGNVKYSLTNENGELIDIGEKFYFQEIIPESNGGYIILNDKGPKVYDLYDENLNLITFKGIFGKEITEMRSIGSQDKNGNRILRFGGGVFGNSKYSLFDKNNNIISFKLDENTELTEFDFIETIDNEIGNLYIGNIHEKRTNYFLDSKNSEIIKFKGPDKNSDKEYYEFYNIGSSHSEIKNIISAQFKNEGKEALNIELNIKTRTLQLNTKKSFIDYFKK